MIVNHYCCLKYHSGIYWSLTEVFYLYSSNFQININSECRFFLRWKYFHTFSHDSLPVKNHIWIKNTKSESSPQLPKLFQSTLENHILYAYVFNIFICKSLTICAVKTNIYYCYIYFFLRQTITWIVKDKSINTHLLRFWNVFSQLSFYDGSALMYPLFDLNLTCLIYYVLIPW